MNTLKNSFSKTEVINMMVLLHDIWLMHQKETKISTHGNWNFFLEVYGHGMNWRSYQKAWCLLTFWLLLVQRTVHKICHNFPFWEFWYHFRSDFYCLMKTWQIFKNVRIIRKWMMTVNHSFIKGNVNYLEIFSMHSK